MTAERFHLIETAFGACGLAWNERGVARLQLPEATAEAPRARLARHGAGEAPLPPSMLSLATALRRYFGGEAVAFDGVAIAWGEGIGLAERAIYDATRKLGWGETATYGEIATRAGMPGAARVVGRVMARNPVPVIVPCHRVLAAGGRPGGFSAPGGIATKDRLLALERVLLPI
jgi:methylated-DNA-[protein]-cysteine S-methyltransferase